MRISSYRRARTDDPLSLYEQESHRAIPENAAAREEYPVEGNPKVLDQVQLDSMECWAPPDW